MQNFKDWLLSEDIFGFEKRNAKKITKNKIEDYIVRIDPDIIFEVMMKRQIGGYEPFSEFHDQIQWGRESGAVQMVVSPLGSFKNITRKLQVDLQGNKVWVCKKIMPYKEILHSDRQFDEELAEDILEDLDKIYKQDIEAPSKEYKNLERLVIKISNVLRRKDIIPKILIYRGTKQIKKNENYLIYFECRGHGVESPGSARLEQFIVDMSYNPLTGMIRSFGHNVESPTKGHLWYPSPSEWDEYFSSSQKEEEIADCISKALSTY